MHQEEPCAVKALSSDGMAGGRRGRTAVAGGLHPRAAVADMRRVDALRSFPAEDGGSAIVRLDSRGACATTAGPRVLQKIRAREAAAARRDRPETEGAA